MDHILLPLIVALSPAVVWRDEDPDRPTPRLRRSLVRADGFCRFSGRTRRFDVSADKSFPRWRMRRAVRTAAYVVAVSLLSKSQFLSASHFAPLLDPSTSCGTTSDTSRFFLPEQTVPVARPTTVDRECTSRPCVAALPSAAFRYFDGTQPQHGYHRHTTRRWPSGFSPQDRIG